MMAPMLVLLHGFTHTGASWDPVRSELGERYRALAPDIRGHGSASEREPVTLPAVLDDIGALEPERFTLAGYSMGGRLALQFAQTLKRIAPVIQLMQGHDRSYRSGRRDDTHTQQSRGFRIDQGRDRKVAGKISQVGSPGTHSVRFAGLMLHIRQKNTETHRSVCLTMVW